MPLTDDFFTDDPEVVNATFTLSDDSETEVSGIFRDSSDGVENFGMQIEAVKANFECETAQIASVVRGNAVEIDSVNYTVEKIQRTGVGISVVYLKNA